MDGNVDHIRCEAWCDQVKATDYKLIDSGCWCEHSNVWFRQADFETGVVRTCDQSVESEVVR